MDFHFESEFNPIFVGREVELKWLDERLFRRYSFAPIIISGPAGVGKTALINKWFSSKRISYTPLWLDLSSHVRANALNDLIIQIDTQRENYRYQKGLTVIIDGSDAWTQKQHEEAVNKIFNYKAVSSLIFICRGPLKLQRAQQLSLAPLSNFSARDLLRNLLSEELTNDQIAKAMLASKGYPLAITILSKLIKGESINSILSFASEPIYDISHNILLPSNEITIATKPIIVSANNNLISRLKKHPSHLHTISPREFEELLADLLKDMGWEVELTPKTRDGGSDILAYLNTEVGRLLCLVEAKHYREDRKIGVDLIRTLYGTLCDAQANSAMLVTTSSFTSGAKEFQQKHTYQLTLRDYADVVEWILKFGNKQTI